mmetsp:Transcript_14527/g.23593  ORF Transcript_14527/g.23593 Transcript_14527/m.23593 type:complete len:80 (+) Transcript_14527:525-764(+)
MIGNPSWSTKRQKEDVLFTIMNLVDRHHEWERACLDHGCFQGGKLDLSIKFFLLNLTLFSLNYSPCLGGPSQFNTLCFG